MSFDEYPDRFDTEEPDAERRRSIERLLPELIKRLVEVGASKIAEGPENLRHLVGELRLPKEIVNYIFSQIDDTKNGVYRVVAKEIRDVLEHTNLAEQVTHALTTLSFEIRTEIRFVPNDSNPKLFPKPDVQAKVTIRDDDKPAGGPPQKDDRSRKGAR